MPSLSAITHPCLSKTLALVRHTTVRCSRKVFYTALLCAASLWGGAELCLERTSLVFGAPMGQPRGWQLGTDRCARADGELARSRCY